MSTAYAPTSSPRRTAATAIGWTLGLIGTVALAIAVFQILGMIVVPMLPFAVAGIALWLLAPLVSRAVRGHRAATPGA